MSHILVFGDSVAYGRWDAVRGGWVSQLIDLCMKKDLTDTDHYHEVYNLSIDGDDSTRLLSRFEFEAKQRFGESDIIFIFAVGKNDSLFIKKSGYFLTPTKVFEKNIRKLIKFSQKYSSKIIFVGVAMVDERRTMPVYWDNNLYYKNEYIKKYNEIIRYVCKENNIDFIEIFNEFQKLDYKKLLEDGVHPNSKGHSLIYETVKDYLVAKKII